MKKKCVLSMLLAISLLAGGLLAGQEPVPQPTGPLIGEVLSDIYVRETMVLVKVSREIKLDQALTFISRDGTHGETVEVKHVYDSYVWLKSSLKHEYLVGSKIYQ